MKIRLVTPPRVMFCVPNGRVNEPAPSTDSVDRRTPALTVTRGRTCQVSCTNPPISFALVGGSSGPRRARVTRKRLGLPKTSVTFTEYAVSLSSWFEMKPTPPRRSATGDRVSGTGPPPGS